MPPPETEQYRWFTTEVQPNEPALRSYLRARFPSLPDVDDIIQETYRRLFREHAAGRVRYARAFMFTAARNVALDFFRHHRVAETTAVTHLNSTDVLEEQLNAADAAVRQQELELLAEAVRALPQRCRQVILLRYMKNYSYKEIASALGISTETVKTHMAKGLERCTAFFEERGLLPPSVTPGNSYP
jgi:RNA polymerase sigma factor (sigma-70 family)